MICQSSNCCDPLIHPKVTIPQNCALYREGRLQVIITKVVSIYYKIVVQKKTNKLTIIQKLNVFTYDTKVYTISIHANGNCYDSVFSDAQGIIDITGQKSFQPVMDCTFQQHQQVPIWWEEDWSAGASHSASLEDSYQEHLCIEFQLQ